MGIIPLTQEQVIGYFYDSLGRLEDKKYYEADASPGDYANSNYPDNCTDDSKSTVDLHFFYAFGSLGWYQGVT